MTHKLVTGGLCVSLRYLVWFVVGCVVGLGFEGVWGVVWVWVFFHPRPHLPPAKMGAVPLGAFVNESSLPKNHKATINKAHRRGEFRNPSVPAP